jgi:hypothetical protein
MSGPYEQVRTLSGCELLHPQSCMSSIRYSAQGYKKKGKRYFSAQVVLTDCNREITWSEYGDGGAQIMDDKLAEAIKGLQAARKAIKEAKAHYDSLAPKPRSRRAERR